jgi:hypothetical protein
MQPERFGGILYLLVLISIIAIIAQSAPVFGAAALTLSQSSGITGTVVEVKGSGFDTADATASLVFGNASSTFTAKVIPAFAIVGGNFTSSFQVPVFPRGSYSVIVNTLKPETAAANFQIIPAIALKTTSGPTGSQISVSGTGFDAGNTISGFFDNTVISTTTADANGAFSNLLITIPDTSKGSHSIKAADSGGPSSSVIYTVIPRISVVPAEASVGNQVNVSGSGFPASSPITFSLDELSIRSMVTTGAAGSFTATALTVPIIYSGEHTLKAQDHTGSQATATLTTRGVFNINPQSGPANTIVAVSGIGFGPGKNIIITFNGVNIGTIPSVVTSDANGNFSASLIIPGTASGAFPIAITDGATSLMANFTATATAIATQNQGPVGGNIPISGKGFNAGNTINIKYDGLQIGTATADNNGAFSAIIPAPVSTAGEHKVVASDGVNSIDFLYTIVPNAQINMDNGHVGFETMVSGSAFTPRGNINVKFGSSQVAAAKADDNGVFSAAFKVPAAKGGKYVISATDGPTTFTFNFTIETTPPAAPVPITPPKDAKTDSLAEFQWSPVTDPSGVTYQLEVAHDSAFAVLLIKKPGLTAPKYQISDEDQLGSTGEDQPYYWRVRAIDGALNESAWSPAWPFVVGQTLPSWIWYPIGVIAAVLFFGAGLIIGRRLERHRLA